MQGAPTKIQGGPGFTLLLRHKAGLRWPQRGNRFNPWRKV